MPRVDRGLLASPIATEVQRCKTWVWLWGISTPTVVVVIWAVVALDYAHLSVFPEPGRYENRFTIDGHRDVY